MGRQIEYYMELDSYKLLVKKAFDLGLKVLVKEQNRFKIYNDFEEINFSRNEMYFFLEEAGPVIITQNRYIDSSRSPLVETGFSFINEKKKEISKSRIWVSTGFWNNSEEFMYRNEILDKKYSALMRYIKKLAPYTEVWIKAQNPMYDGRKMIRKVYITSFLLKKIESGEYDCI